MRIISVLLFLLAAAAGDLSATGICAHRGANRAAPENTLPAFTAALKAGVGQIEFDVDCTKDGVLVLMHDATVDRTTNGKGKVSELTFKEIRALDAGAKFGPSFAGTKVPTLREALEVIPPRILCDVHVKGDERAAVEAAKLIRDMGRLKQCFLAMGETQLGIARAARAAVPDIMICKGWAAARAITPETASIEEKPGTERPAPLDRINFIQLVSFTSAPPADSLKMKVDELHRLDIVVNFCCTDNEKIARILIEAGVDYILTDDIPLVRGVIESAKKR